MTVDYIPERWLLTGLPFFVVHFVKLHSTSNYNQIGVVVLTHNTLYQGLKHSWVCGPHRTKCTIIFPYAFHSPFLPEI